jgi:hypothetical protein
MIMKTSDGIPKFCENPTNIFVFLSQILIMEPLWIRKTQNKLRNTINTYDRNLSPLGIRVKKFGNPNMFEVTYGLSRISVSTNPYRLSGNLYSGETNVKNRGKGIALALRTFATALLRNAGYVKIKHQGVNFQNRNNASRQKTQGLPVTTHIVRKYLGFRPVGLSENYRSVWRKTNAQLKKLQNAERLAKNKLRNQRNTNL